MLVISAWAMSTSTKNLVEVSKHRLEHRRYRAGAQRAQVADNLSEVTVGLPVPARRRVTDRWVDLLPPLWPVG